MADISPPIDPAVVGQVIEQTTVISSEQTTVVNQTTLIDQPTGAAVDASAVSDVIPTDTGAANADSAPQPLVADTTQDVMNGETIHDVANIQNHSNNLQDSDMTGTGAPAEPEAATAAPADKEETKQEDNIDADGDAEMSFNELSDDEGSVFEPEDESPKPKAKARGGRKSNAVATVNATLNAVPQTGNVVAHTNGDIVVPITPGPAAQNPNGTPITAEQLQAQVTPGSVPKTPGPAGVSVPKTPANKTPLNRVRSGRIDKSGNSPMPSTLECPVAGCEQKFSGRNPRQSLWHHLKYYATRGLPEKEEFEKAHGEAHAQMKREAEPKGTPVERNRISSSDYRKKNPEKAKTSARLSNFRARARKKGITDEKEVEEMVAKWEKEWQDKQAKEASEYFSGILLSAFE